MIVKRAYFTIVVQIIVAHFVAYFSCFMLAHRKRIFARSFVHIGIWNVLLNSLQTKIYLALKCRNKKNWHISIYKMFNIHEIIVVHLDWNKFKKFPLHLVAHMKLQRSEHFEKLINSTFDVLRNFGIQVKKSARLELHLSLFKKKN